MSSEKKTMDDHNAPLKQILRRFTPGRHGKAQAILEFALVLVVLVALVFGTI